MWKPATATRSRTTGRASPRATGATITYADLQRDVVRFANALKKLGVSKGTPVAIYMGMVPELAVAMLACARLGAPHTVVFGGFSADSLSGRMNDMKCEVLITQDEAWRRGSTVPLKRTADDAMAAAPGVRASSSCVAPAATCRCRTAATTGWHELEDRARTTGVVPVRADGQRGPALPHVHERNDREAEGDRAHDGRLPRRRLDDAPLHLRPQAGRGCLLVRRRHRLDHRAQLHRVRAALQRGHLGHVRGDARLPDKDRWWDVVERYKREHPLYRADGDPIPHEVGPSTRSSTTCRRCACSGRSASRSTRRPGSGTGSTSAAIARRSWTRGGRPRRG